MSTAQTKKLGEKYILLDRIGIGGMAEVYRSKLLGEKGFEKLIVIKKLLPQLVQDKEMVQLFIGEARLAALLQHENIASTYDFGEIEGSFFLAMEYLSGKDLHAVMQRSAETQIPLDPSHALMVISKVCEAMDYAHNLKDLQNKSLNIIHRDLTPHNIFITYDGKVKVLDFGVAKTELLGNRTKADVVKGKISYMSPEQMAGEEIDARSDIFSIGILLYEMISGKRMYSGDTAALIKKCISVDYVPLEETVPGLPPELYALLHKALSNDLDVRYQSCAEMQSDIDDLLFNMSVRPDSKALKNTIRELFADDYELDQQQTIKVLKDFSGKNVLQDLDESLIAEVLGNEGTQYDKTIHYASLKESGRRKMLPPIVFNNRWSLLMGGSTLLILLAFLLPGWLQENEVAETSPPVAILQDTEPSTPPETLRKPEISNDQITVTKLLQQAEKAMADKRIVEPENDSALRYFKMVLLLDPDNRTAREGLLTIGDKYARQTDKALAEKNFLEAEDSLKTGLAISPEHQRLQALEKETAEQKQVRIAELTRGAKQRLASNKITSPPDDSAFSHYNEILKIDPDNIAAQEAIQKIAARNASGDRYVEMADTALAKKRFVEAEEYVATGLSISPDHAGLQSLKETLETQRQTAIHKLVLKAEQCLKEDQLTTPKDDSAFLHYSEILKVDPKSSLAQEGFGKIADRYAVIAGWAFRQFNFDTSSTFVRNGLEVVPDHPRLLGLQEDLNRGHPGLFFKSVEKNVNALIPPP